MKGTKMLLGCALLAASLVASNAQAQTTLRMTWYSDGNEGEVMTDLLRRFEEQNKDIKVVLDQVPFKAINENLPVQLAAGQGPDLARVADLGGVARYMLDLRPLLKDPAYFETNFGPFLEWMRLPGDTTSIPGYMTQLTVTGPFVNKTLFEQASVADARCEGNLGRVGQGREGRGDESTGAVPGRDRPLGPPLLRPCDHRRARRSSTTRASPRSSTTASRRRAQLVYDWHKNGVMSKELWGSVAGTAYRGANDEFKNAQVVMYVSGSWQISQFDKTIGNAFDWVAVPTPCGPATAPACPAARRWSPSRRPSTRKRSHGSWNISPASQSVGEFYPAHALRARAISALPRRALTTRTPSPQAKAALKVFSERRSNALAGRLQAAGLRASTASSSTR